MGFFYTGKEAIQATAVEARRKRAAKNVALVDRLRAAASQGCSACPLDKAKLHHPKMPPTGAREPAVYVLGEAPGAQEDEDGEQFVGKSGELLRSLIPPKYAKQFRWNNVIRCRPPQNRDPEPIERECCRPLQVADIERAQPAAIFGFGLVPLQWATGMANPKMQAWRGRRMPVQVGEHVCWYYCLQHPAFILRKKNDRERGGREAEDAFRWDVERAIRDVFEGDLREPRVPSKAERSAGIRTPMLRYADLARALTEAERWPEMGIDIETNGLRPYFRARKILTLAVSCGHDTVAFPYQHPGADWGDAFPQVRARVKRFLLNSGRKWAHSLRFELEWLADEFGEEVLRETAWGDTLAMAYVLDEREDAKSLGALTTQYFGFDVKAESSLDVRNLASEPVGEVLLYNGMDAKWCYHLRAALGQAHIDAGLHHSVYNEQVRRSPTLVAMQRAGLVPNARAVAKLERAWEPRYERAKETLLKNPDVVAYGRKTGRRLLEDDRVVPSAQALLAFFDFVGLRRHLRVDDKYGGEPSYSTAEDALARLRHPVAKAIPELRLAQKMLSTYIRKMRPGGGAVHEDGLVHTQFNADLTSTRRLSSEDPNGQNFPKRENREVREVIGAPPGHRMVSIDYAQLEARVIAMASRDRTLVREVRAGEDIHGDWRDEIAREWPAIVGGRAGLRDKVAMKKFRDTIKNTWTFPLFFGSVLPSVARGLTEWTKVEIDPKRLEPYFNRFWDKYGGVLAWQDEVQKRYRQVHYAETLTGFRRHAPLTRNEMINSPIQGTASDIVVDAMCRLAERAWREGIPPLLPRLNIHDDLTFYFPDDGLEELIEFAAREMVACPFEFARVVPLAVEVSVGDNWYQQEEVAKFSSEDFK